MAVPDELGHAQRTPCVPRGGLDPQPFEGPFPQQAPVGDAVQRHPAGQTEIFHSRFAVHGACHAQHDLFAHHLDRTRQIHLALRQLRLRDARRTAEQAVERAVGHRQAREIVEVFLVERERAVVAQVHELTVDQVHVLGLAVRREAHHFVLSRVHLEARVVRERGVEQSERVRPVQLGQELDVGAATHAARRRSPLAHAVHGQDRRFVEWRGEERAGGVRLVVLAVQEIALVPTEGAPDVPIRKELFLDPQRPRHAERGETARRDAQVGLKDPLELEERLVIEPHALQIRGLNAGGAETVGHGLRRERRVPLLARETLLLSRGDDLAILQQAGGAVMIEGRETEDVAWRHGYRAPPTPAAATAPCRTVPPGQARTRAGVGASCAAAPSVCRAAIRASSSRPSHWATIRLPAGE